MFTNKTKTGDSIRALLADVYGLGVVTFEDYQAPDITIRTQPGTTLRSVADALRKLGLKPRIQGAAVAVAK